jgi:hypothetical protein
MYKIAYIDESISDIHDFQDYVKHAQSSHYFKLDVMEPQAGIDSFVNKLIESHYQAYIIDFHLKDKNSSIEYNGWELGKKILAIREKFPVFILTSYQEDAQNDSDDVNIIYGKTKVVQEEDNNFLERVRLQIDKYEKLLEKAENRILALLKAQKTRALTYDEEHELVENNIFIEKALNKTALIPNNLQSQSGKKHLDDILTLLQKMEGELKELNTNKK